MVSGRPVLIESSSAIYAGFDRDALFGQFAGEACMTVEQPYEPIPQLSRAEICAAIQTFCITDRTYDITSANAWLMSKSLIVPQKALFTYLLKAFRDQRQDIARAELSYSNIARRLHLEGLTRDHCAAMLHVEDGSYRFSYVVTLDPDQVWPPSQPRPTVWSISQIDTTDLQLMQKFAGQSVTHRGHPPMTLSALTPVAPQEPSPQRSDPVQPTYQVLLATYPDLANSEPLQVARLNDSVELSTEDLRAILIDAITNCLDKTHSDRDVAWRVNNDLLISESSLLHQLSVQTKRLLGSEVKLDPAPFDRLLTLNLIKRTHSYFLSFDTRFQISKWRSLLAIHIDVFNIGSALKDSPSWILSSVESPSLRAEENHGDTDATRHRANRWDLALLLPADARHSAQPRPSTALPIPHVVIATYHGDPSHGLPVVSRSIEQ